MTIARSARLMALYSNHCYIEEYLIFVLEIYRAILRTLNNIVYIPLATLLSRDEYDNAEVVVIPLGLRASAVILQLEGKLARCGLASLDCAEREAREIGV